MSDPRPSPLEDFEHVRSRLFGLAYRMLGSRADAEDVVQEAYLRWHETDRDAVRNPEAWLVTATTRLSIDRLRALKRSREAYAGPWLPEPLIGSQPAPPDRAADLAADLSLAFLVLLERLGPEERAAFLLHDVFDCGYGEIARILGKSQAACRQIVHRARERVQTDQKRFQASDAAKVNLLRKFTAALEAGDERALLALFAPDATWTADGGGRAAASPRPIVGAERIVTLVLGLQQRVFHNAARLDPVSVNGEAGLTVHANGQLVGVMTIDTDGERILAVYAVVNPDKLGGPGATAVTPRPGAPSLP